tara:strand:- start:317 stop:946 length:630 start_codon:yes stop_codon:yes gene_type:complete
MTHDSIGLGEDGPTHQPIEQISSLRSIPNLNVFRPSDTIETFECWELALKNNKTPSVIALSRQKVIPIRKQLSNENKSQYGAYEVFRTQEKIDLTIFASGSEVGLAVDVSHKLATQNTQSKVISVPCQELFHNQKEAYKDNILNETINKISIEAGSTETWRKFIGSKGMSFGVNEFGKSAPYKEIYKNFKLTVNDIVETTLKMIRRNNN